MEKKKLIRLLFFWCDLYNFVIGVGLVVESQVGLALESHRWLLMSSGLALSVISVVPSLYSLIRRSDENSQVYNVNITS